ncbi:MAG: hypothetical protein M1815_003506 [Lichina confinis]|nr:MAG: hypothetical protein M1815_003506 [Lichina confinis]
MPFGKLYTKEANARSVGIRAVAKANDIDLDVVETKTGADAPPEYLKLNPLGRIPTFEGEDGYVLTEAIAIAIYITSQNGKTTLLGKTKQDYASILKWMSLANSEVLPSLSSWFGPLIGRDSYNKKNVEESAKATNKAVGVLESHLLLNTYLVGERLTLADIFSVGVFTRGFQYVFDKKWREEHPNVTRWYETVYNQPIFSEVVPKLSFIEEAVKYQQPKKESAPKKEAAPKAAAKPKQKEADEDEDEDKPAPKPKHPLEALEKPTLILDDWKRKYSNEDLRKVAYPWFWENYKPEEYSLWKLEYKYNDELTMVFMSANLIGGFFNRLEASRKFLFGAASVYGKANESVIVGAFLVRGQEAQPAFDVAPDFDSFNFVKLDPSKTEDREFIEDQWELEKPVAVKGQEYPFADGKVFK